MNRLVAVAQLAVCFVLVFCINSNGQNHPKELVGRWMREVYGGTRIEHAELFQNGKLVWDDWSRWEVMGERRLLVSGSDGNDVFDYEISGYKLILVDNAGKNIIFIRRENWEEFLADKVAAAKAAKEKEDEEKRIAAEAERARIVNAKEDARRSIKTFVDSRNGKKYKQVTIGDVTWMAENLNFAINGSLCYGNKPENCEKYGRLYTWDASNKACPVGWRLPNKSDWEKFAYTSGNSNDFGTEIKSTNGWEKYEEKDGNGTNVWGFSALPGGRYYTAMSNGISDPSNKLGDGFRLKGYAGWWWTSSMGYYYGMGGGSYHQIIGAYTNSDKLGSDDVLPNWANNYYYSVRCVMCTEEERVKAEEEMEKLKKTHIVDSRDGNKYKKIVIGNKTWMGEDFNYTTSLYTWDAAMKACPAGTHLPSLQEWDTMMEYVNKGKVIWGMSVPEKKLESYGFYAQNNGDLSL